MNFARKELEKYGWTEGSGLGKLQTGITTPLKPQLKYDNCGLGYDIAVEHTTRWWEELFNAAASNINVNNDNSEIKLKVKVDLPDPKTNNNFQYNEFKKTSTLVGGTMTDFGQTSNEVLDNSPVNFNICLTDEELFRACSGRTVHVGARHGIKQSGKLSRIDKQEKMLLKKMRKVSLSNEEEDSTERKLKKLKKQMEKFCTIEDHAHKTSTNLKKRKKQKKSVSFNETVTTIVTKDLDTSFESEADSSIVGDELNNLFIENCNTIEEIDQETETTTKTLEFDHRDLSKAERQKLRKKKIKTEPNSFVDPFQIPIAFNSAEITADCDDKNKKSKKRKCLNKFDYSQKTEPFIYDPSDKGWNKTKRGKMKDN